MLNGLRSYSLLITFSSKYKECNQNVMVDALSRRHSLLTVMEQKVLGSEFMKELYKDDSYFYEDWLAQMEDNRVQGTKGSYRNLLIKEVHSSDIGGHFEVQKTLDILQDQFCWPKMMGDVVQIVLRRCAICQ
ncbi:uncharacterized protein LOC141614039 [Silene latifolia]|uniref:uncharacterized protein LOC141614039 n=1 Tax=Silene latifolia TaxID=37657 RepID=UPI003D774F75